MSKYVIDVIPTLFLVLFLWSLRPVKPLGAVNEDYLSLDTCLQYRGLFAVMVVIHHLTQFTETGVIIRGFFYIGEIPVAFFFFLSGYGLQKSYILKKEKYRKGFLRKRIPPVLVPYAVVNLIYWVMYAVIGRECSPRDILISMIDGDPVVLFSWYIICILVFYFVYWGLMLVCKGRYRMMLGGGLIWYIVYVLLCMNVAGYGPWWYMTCHLFLIGMTWATYEKRLFSLLCERIKILFPVSWIAFLLTLCLKERLVAIEAIPGFPAFCYMLIPAWAVFNVILLSMKTRISNQVLRFLGKISLEIYLVQGIFMLIFRSNRLYIRNEFLCCSLVLACTILFGYCLHYAISLFFKTIQK